MKKFLVAWLWLMTGVLNYGLSLGYFTHKYPWVSHTSAAVFLGLTGPIGVPATLLLSPPYHLRFKPLTTDQRWDAFHEEFPELSRQDWDRVNN